MATKTVEQTANKRDQLSAELKREVLNQKRQIYLQHQYDAELEYKIASKLGDEKAKETQMQRLKRIEEILAILDGESLAPMVGNNGKSVPE